ncbi:helix-turn-helix transcriptional regulator [Desulfoscipio geothermicus]|uniref:DNA-binding transcriptional regulator, XRE-family HTH domain n=1 Tax=Desulfoscipio geothermicus DSM 3669 TaxID=1121426 RepID=A0A1I6E499_9FIRM|nr:helix-turn-helix transcriptional regulator [Desulfoscipio geothermicus]SFR12372.1 DNA-binding transcriptional regulator, XRE-family HTH domain [Desulfoscipio geothermicus DSM 3669]
MREWLKRARETANLEPGEIAKAIGIKKRMYYAIESGKANPSWPVAKRLGDYFNQDPRVLLAETKDSDSVNC